MTEQAIETATAVIKEWRASGNIWHAAVPVAAALATERAAAEQRGAERVAQRMRELADTYAFLGATLHNVPKAETFTEVADELRAALADVAPPTAGREGRVSAQEQARRWGGCGEVINVDAWCDADAVPSTAGLCDSPAKHRDHSDGRADA